MISLLIEIALDATYIKIQKHVWNLGHYQSMQAHP
jgi:hypothetical protein